MKNPVNHVITGFLVDFYVQKVESGTTTIFMTSQCLKAFQEILFLEATELVTN